MGYRADGRAARRLARRCGARARAGHGRVRRADPAGRGRAGRRRQGERRLLGRQGIAETVVEKLKAAIDDVGGRVTAAARRPRPRAAPAVPSAAPAPARSCAGARSGCSTPGSAGSPCCTSCSSRCRTRTSSTSATPRASPTASARPAELAAFALADRRGAARARGEAARRRLQLGDRGGAAGAARRLMETTLGVDVIGVVRPERGAGGRGDAQRPRRAARHAGDRRERRLRARARGAPTRIVELTAVACPDLAPIIQAGFPFDQRVVDTVRALLRAAARGRRRHGDPRLHALPAGPPDAPAHARPRRDARHLRARRSRAGSSTRSARAGSATRARARATTASCAPATSRRSARSAPASCRCRSAHVEHVDVRRRDRPHELPRAATSALLRPRARRPAPDDHRARLRPHRDRLGADLAAARRA